MSNFRLVMKPHAHMDAGIDSVNLICHVNELVAFEVIVSGLTAKHWKALAIGGAGTVVTGLVDHMRFPISIDADKQVMFERYDGEFLTGARMVTRYLIPFDACKDAFAETADLFY